MKGHGIEKLQKAISKNDCSWNIRLIEECRSTNEEILSIIKEEPKLVDNGFVLFTNWQSHGKGRRGAKWESRKSNDLLFSIALSPIFDPTYWTRFTHATALGISNGLKKLNFDPSIKWPNDIYIKSRKVAGILVESYPEIINQNNNMGIAIIGVGLNINSKKEDFSDSYRTPATSLSIQSDLDHNELDRFLVAEQVLTELNIQLQRCYQNFSDILSEIKESSFVYGKNVEIQLSGGGSVSGKVIDFGEEGELIIQRANVTGAEAAIEKISSAHELRLI
ncbi:MAG: biotin--[acetyl-CoA-carboxylase] ligase [Verrucomicrobiales bacterium]|nr:biotin--[acetyl-CoA-carboxylase] ligase [Verrucomicrobiales bacterium]